MPTESAPLCDGAKIDLTEAPNAPVQKPFAELSRPKVDLMHQFLDPHDVGCIKAAANGTLSHVCGCSPDKEISSATKQAMFEELGKGLKGDPALLSDLGVPKDTSKIGSMRKPLSFDDPNEENVDEEEDASEEEEEYDDEDEEDEEQDDEDEEQGESDEDEDEKAHDSDEYGDDDELSEPPPKRKK